MKNIFYQKIDDNDNTKENETKEINNQNVNNNINNLNNKREKLKNKQQTNDNEFNQKLKEISSIKNSWKSIIELESSNTIKDLCSFNS